MIKKWIFWWKIKNEKSVMRKAIDYNDAKHFGLLVNLNEIENIVWAQQLIEKLKSEKKKVQLLVFLSKVTKDQIINFSYFTIKDYDIFSGWKTHLVEDFCNEKFDFLIHLSEVPHFITDYIVKKSNSICTVGIVNQIENHQYEMNIIVSKNAGLEQKQSEIWKYLQKIKS